MQIRTVPFPALIESVHSYLPPEKARFVEGALKFATEAHRGQQRKSGHPYIEHPVATALHLAEMRLDATTLAAALLHDVMEDCGVSYDELSRKFGPDVAKLVDGVTKLNRLDRSIVDPDGTDSGDAPPDLTAHSSSESARTASLRKMLVAMAEDIRVVIIKLSDRLHNMQTLSHLSPDRQQRIARETLDIYAPLAHRLGMADIKWRLEDAAFRYLMPKEYKATSRLINRKRHEREAYAQRVTEELDSALKRAGVNALVTGRPKHLMSTYSKLKRYEEQGRKFDDIYDLTGLRVIVDTVANCYAALGVAHSIWKPVPGQFDDYIANPKDNFYQSLHTAVTCEGGYPVEVQIRTKEMHRIAEEGVAAHWAYKEGEDVGQDDRFEQKMSWLKQLLDWQREMSGDEEYLDSVKTDILRDQVFVSTPKGDVVDLPAGATPLDFAYRIHTELGHNCVGGVVNGKLVALNTPLKNGDTVEIKKSKAARGPSLDWLNPGLGYLVTNSAQAKVRAWFRRQERGANIERGREQLRKDLRRVSVSMPDEAIASLLGYKSVDDLAEAVGSGDISIANVIGKLGDLEQATPIEEKPAAPPAAPPANTTDTGVVVMGEGNMLTRVAQCCSPVYGDEIAGYVTRGRGVTVHRRNCPTLLAIEDPERIVQAAWGHSEAAHPARLIVEAYDRVGLLRDITNVVSGENVNIHSMSSAEDGKSGISTVSLTVYTSGVEQLSRLFARLETITGVRSVQRTTIGHRAPES